MAYNHEYPYTDPNRYNDDWLLNKMKELEQKIIGIEEDILRDAKIYIDEQLSVYIAEVEAIRREFTIFKNEIEAERITFENRLSTEQANYESVINARIRIIESRVDAFSDEIHNAIIGVNARTDLAIEQNNEYIFSVLSEDILGALKVINFFTGELISVQDMFNYLANLHVSDGLTYTDLVERDKTYSELAALNISYTDLVLHGGSLII